jgi:hypothetical protein
MQLGLAAAVESCFCQRKCLDDSAKGWFIGFGSRQQVNISSRREALIAVYTIFPATATVIWIGGLNNISFLSRLLTSVDGLMLPLLAFHDGNEVLTSPVQPPAPLRGHI